MTLQGLPLSEEALRAIWKEPSALDCRWRVANLVVGEACNHRTGVNYDL